MERQKYWTPTGIDCHHSKANCIHCPVFLNFGLRKDHPNEAMRCRQPQSNQNLIDWGLTPPPDEDKALKLVHAFMGDRKAVFS